MNVLWAHTTSILLTYNLNYLNFAQISGDVPPTHA